MWCTFVASNSVAMLLAEKTKNMKFFLIGNSLSEDGMDYKVIKVFNSKKEAIGTHQKYSTRTQCELHRVDNIGWLVQAKDASTAIGNVSSRRCKNLWERV